MEEPGEEQNRSSARLGLLAGGRSGLAARMWRTARPGLPVGVGVAVSAWVLASPAVGRSSMVAFGAGAVAALRMGYAWRQGRGRPARVLAGSAGVARGNGRPAAPVG